jgi:hypothetical protein
MRVLGGSVLGFEAIVVLLAIPTAIALAGVPPLPTIITGVVLAILLVVNAGLLTHPRSFATGWILQGVVIATGVVAWPMFGLGVVFLLLWWLALRVGRRVEQGRGDGPGAAG